MRWFLMVVRLVVLSMISAVLTTAAPPPVILIPGYGGSQIEASLNRSTNLHYFCSKTSDWFTLWLNIPFLVWPLIECFADNMRLLYDRNQGLTRNNEGVQTRVPGFGQTETVEFFDPSNIRYSSYFAPLVNRLVSGGGYVRGQNLQGAPYDFRKSPFELDQYFRELSDLVEKSYQKNGQRKVVLVAHSMGGTLTLFWLQNQSLAWKSKYIRALVSLGTPWIGVVKTLRVVISGDNINLYVVNPRMLRPIQRSPSSIFLFPSPKHWNQSDGWLVTGANRTFGANDYRDLFRALDYEDGLDIWSRMKDRFDPAKAPEVETHIVYSKNVPTPTQYIYPPNSKSWFDNVPTIVYGDGDGTVNLQSLQAAQKLWKQKQLIRTFEIDKSEHLVMLGDKRVLDHVEKLLDSFKT